jgi:carboxymethylenebutenolidase
MNAERGGVAVLSQVDGARWLSLEGQASVNASFGGRDLTGRGAPEKLQRVLDHKGITNDVKSYPEVGHSFANKLPAQPLLRIAGFGYNEAATEDAWARVFSFFGEHLGS